MRAVCLIFLVWEGWVVWVVALVGRRRSLLLGSLRGRGRRSEVVNANYDEIDLVDTVQSPCAVSRDELEYRSGTSYDRLCPVEQEMGLIWHANV